MNIVFLLKGLTIGGVEIVTVTLANKFVQEGHQVSLFVTDPEDLSVKNRLDSKVHVYEGVGLRYCTENIKRLRTILEKENIDLIINQWGLHWLTTRIARAANKNRRCKIITEYHNDPKTNGQMQAIDLKLAKTKFPLLRSILYVKRFLVRLVTGLSMRYVYECSDLYLLLSPSFKESFKKFIWLNSDRKIGVMSNPITTKNGRPQILENKKEKCLLMVGRIDFNQKRNFRAVDVWKFLERKHPDWSLFIVGDGSDMSALKGYVKNSGLKNIHLEGFKNPIEYYQKASLLILTSEYEGFGLVIVEGMSYGVIPIVLDSYDSAHDIIQNGENGFLEPYNKEQGFDAASMAKKIELLMQDEALSQKMSQRAFESSSAYTINSIYKNWQNIFDTIR